MYTRDRIKRSAYRKHKPFSFYSNMITHTNKGRIQDYVYKKRIYVSDNDFVDIVYVLGPDFYHNSKSLYTYHIIRPNDMSDEDFDYLPEYKLIKANYFKFIGKNKDFYITPIGKGYYLKYENTKARILMCSLDAMSVEKNNTYSNLKLIDEL